MLHLFLVEGIMDALRLEQLGHSAVSIFGSELTAGQVELLVDLAHDLERQDWSLAVHILLDNDLAGRQGAFNAVIRLLPALLNAENLVFDVLVIPQQPTLDKDSTAGTESKDPDRWLSGLTPDESKVRLHTAAFSSFDYLLSHQLGVPPSALGEFWTNASVSTRQQAVRSIWLRLEQSKWDSIASNPLLFEQHLRDESPTEPEWKNFVVQLLSKRHGRTPAPVAERADDFHTDRGINARLIHAFQMAKNTTQNREAAVDVGSWERIEAAFDIFLPYLRRVLKSTDIRREYSEECQLIPFLIPKEDGKYRLKALPIPEVLTLQQYFLNELLRTYSNGNRFTQLIPAVRFSTNVDRPTLQTTGEERYRPVGANAVSFAYTVDMDVVDQAVPDKKAGTFLPYQICWRNFLNFIDSRVRKFPKGKFYVARLDIRQCYNSIRKSAVTSVLTPAVQNALKVLKSEGLDFRSCVEGFDEESSDPETRGIQIVDWLAEMTFGYRVERHREFADKHNLNGLPQGPDLSAYLANIALFPLDHSLSKIVNEIDHEANVQVVAASETGEFKVRGAVYARYVDDMVIAARSERDLYRLRSAIEAHLSLMGMELNPKAERLPAMDHDRFRSWLTDQRGDGLTASGPEEETPLVVNTSMVGVIAAPNAVNRKDAIRILYDIKHVRPDRDKAVVLSELRVALTAPRLRHGEHVATASLIWRLVFSESSIGSLEQRVSQFVEDLRSVARIPSGGPTRTSSLRTDWLFASIDGIERVLKSGFERHPAFNEEEQQQLQEEKRKIAQAVAEGLCEEVIGTSERELSADFRFHLDGKTLIIRRLAAVFLRLIGGQGGQNDVGGVATHASQPGMNIEGSLSLMRADVSLKEMNDGDFSDANASSMTHSKLTLLHIAVAKLRSYRQSDGEAPPDPLGWSFAENAFQTEGDPEGTTFLGQVLRLWTPVIDPVERVGEVTTPPEVCYSALMGFANVAPGDQVIKLLQVRPWLVTGMVGQPGCTLIPAPPGQSVKGLMCIAIGRPRSLVRIHLPNGETPGKFEPVDGWRRRGAKDSESRIQSADTPSGDKILVFERDLDGTDQNYLNPNRSVSFRKDPRWLARAYRSLSVGFDKREGIDDGEEFVFPPHALNLLGPAPGDENADSTWSTFGYGVREGELGAQALCRGWTGLRPVAIHDQYCHLWRVGVALSDLLGVFNPAYDHLNSDGADQTEPSSADLTWIQESVVRIALYYLRGAKRRGKIRAFDPRTKLPDFVERALRRLENFPAGLNAKNREDALAYLVASQIEGTAFRVSYELTLDSSAPGSATAMLLRVASSHFRVNAELSEELPEDDDPLPGWAPTLRPALATYCLSRRLTRLETAYSLRDSDESIGYLTAGLRIQCVDFLLQALATQLWDRVDEETRKALRESPPEISSWGLDGTALLTYGGGIVADQTANAKDNTKVLIEALSRGTGVADHAALEQLQRITPLGWLVVIGTLCGQFDGEFRGNVFSSRPDSPVEFPDPSSILSRLIAQPSDSSALPWGFVDGIEKLWTEEALQETIEFISKIFTDTGLNVRAAEGNQFHMAHGSNGGCEIYGSRGSYTIPWWCIVTGRLANEISLDVESEVHDGKVHRRWTEVWYNDKLVSVGIVRPQMARLAGKSFLGHSDGLTTQTPATPANDPKVEVGKQSISVAEESGQRSPIASPESVRSETPAEVPESPEKPVGTKATSDGDGGPTRQPTEALGGIPGDKDGAFLVEQYESWRNRSVTTNSHVRVAFFQWDVDDSYFHPVHEVCERFLERRLSEEIDKAILSSRNESLEGGTQTHDLPEELAKLKKRYSTEIYQSPESWSYEFALSCAEYRRRKLLDRVLRACQEFKVQILLLPEYSVRPETVDWIAQQQANIAPDVAVWAGTYRLPPGMITADPGRKPSLDEIPAWSAVLEILPPVKYPDKRRLRSKKYPSVAVDEVFNPWATDIVPQYPALPWHPPANAGLNHSIYDPRAHAFELICSEAFLFTSPANIFPAAIAHRKLLHKFSHSNRQQALSKIVNETVQADLLNLAMHTAHGAILGPRRTIFLVPAMSNRAEDYTALGQAGYLASGITTVFCNAVHSKYANGSSCFIGHNGWKYNDAVGKPDPSTEPYQGVRPGIFHLNAKGLGKLDKKERALVIADIDPIYAAEGKPRPQMLQKPLQLVAHLPIFETVTQEKADEKANCRCRQGRKKEDNPVDQRIGKVKRVVEAIEMLSRQFGLGDKNFDEIQFTQNVAKVLGDLAKIDDRNKLWLEQRSEIYQRNHLADPIHGLPPALLDWLHVHIDYSQMDPATGPEIEVPTYSHLHGNSRSPDSTDTAEHEQKTV
ncbi:reverse transcriptase domain-containing protein [Planctomicrobium sp. SH527]|uniref:reverse transcriptase domain-containing protein n=1 Tax=Planctomicrobium sp. SH527 TaxID=3448123 RepID=UPI003F5B5FE8